MLILASCLLLLCLTRINGDSLIEAGQNLKEDGTYGKLNSNFKESVFGIENLEKLNTVLDSDYNFINAGSCDNEGECNSKFNAYFKESNEFGDDNHNNKQNTVFTDDFDVIKTSLRIDEEDESYSGFNADFEERGAIKNILTEMLRTDPSVLEDAALDTVALIKKYGYPCEIHRVNTEDGFMLEMHRVPYGRVNNNTANRPVVFLQHGLLSSSGEWVLMRPGKGLAYLLADAGYDVWMGNARGNRYSRKHKRLRPTSASFWKFSWHEIGYYDIPAMIDYILKERGVQKLHYIGFSQGTTVFWVMTSMRPEYNEKIVAMQALAPVAYISHARSPLIRALAPFTRSLHVIFNLLGANEFLPNGWVNEVAGQTLCVEEAITQVLCTNLLFLICGFNSAQLNTTMVPIILGHTPAGASTRQLIHYGQLVNSGQFRRFDYGLISNIAQYGSATPPAYDLEAITVPVFLHYSDNDWLSTPRDVEKLRKRVKTVVGKFRVPLSAFNHLDFVFAIDAKKLIYDRVLNIMARFNEK